MRPRNVSKLTCHDGWFSKWALLNTLLLVYRYSSSSSSKLVLCSLKTWVAVSRFQIPNYRPSRDSRLLGLLNLFSIYCCCITCYIILFNSSIIESLNENNLRVVGICWRPSYTTHNTLSLPSGRYTERLYTEIKWRTERLYIKIKWRRSLNCRTEGSDSSGSSYVILVPSGILWRRKNMNRPGTQGNVATININSKSKSREQRRSPLSVLSHLHFTPLSFSLSLSLVALSSLVGYHWFEVLAALRDFWRWQCRCFLYIHVFPTVVLVCGCSYFSCRDVFIVSYTGIHLKRLFARLFFYRWRNG